MNDSELSHLIHKIRNPLNDISLQAELARVKLQTQQDVQGAEKALESILETCQSCSDILYEVHPDQQG